ncbi:ubiquinol-cytochrome c reductase iron-sulfur subunit [Nitrospinota bacterium]
MDGIKLALDLSVAIHALSVAGVHPGRRGAAEHLICKGEFLGVEELEVATTKEKPRIEIQMPREMVREPPSGMDRRRFMSWTAWFSVLGSLGVALVGFLRFLFPRVLFEPLTNFKAGPPSDYAIGSVDTRYVNAQRVWIIREENGFYALSAICTHLGCTPKWLPSENKFKCPCHGSGFWKSGINFEGPAPRPLERFKIVLAEDGHILVDKSKVFRQERGQWSDSDAYLRV